MENSIKINQLLKSWPTNAVYLTAWLTKHGYSTQLLNRYKKSNWIEAIGSGAMLKSGDSPTIEGAVYALQHQANSHIHPAAKTALEMAGKAHYLSMQQQAYFLFGDCNEKLPIWLKKFPWKPNVKYISSNFLQDSLGLIDYQINEFTIKISSPARALMECLYLAPAKQDLFECYEIMLGLNNLRPNLVQDLLEQCNSIKVKRLFLYLAHKAGHQWVSYINLDKIDMGNGKRKLVENGVYIPQYKITVPKSLENDDV